MATVTPPARALQVLHHRDDAGWWRWTTGVPSPPLTPFFDAYQGYHEQTTRFAVRRELPSARVSLLIDFGTPVRVAGPRPGAAFAQHAGALVVGLDDRWARTDTGGAWHGVQVDLTPLGAHALLGVPMHELTGRLVPLGDLIGRAGDALPERLATLPDWPSRFALLDDFLLGQLRRATLPDPAIDWAWRALHRSAGGIRIGTLTRQLGYSRKQLVARFREQVGLPPKRLARVLRFKSALDRLAAEPRLSLAALAVDQGYYDQAHFNREFLTFAGLSPKAYQSSLLPARGGVTDA